MPANPGSLPIQGLQQAGSPDAGMGGAPMGPPPQAQGGGMPPGLMEMILQMLQMSHQHPAQEQQAGPAFGSGV